MHLLTDEYYPRIEVVFGEGDSFREPLVIDAEEFIGVKGFKAKGKRITTFAVETINELDPVRFPQDQSDKGEESEENVPTEGSEETPKSTTDIIDEITGQMKLFDE